MKKALLSVIFIAFLLTNSAVSQWIQCNGPYAGIIYSLTSNSGYIYAGCEYGNGLYRSTNNGTYWTLTSLTNQSVYALASRANYMFAGTYYGGVFRSTNYGSTWSQCGLDNQFVRSIQVYGNNVVAGTYYNGIYVSTDNGVNWVQTELNNRTVLSISATSTRIFAGTIGNGVYVSTNNGISWSQTTLNAEDVYALAVMGTNVFAGTRYNGVYMSTDSGNNWTQTSLNDKSIYSLCVCGNILLAGTYYDGIHKTTDCGNCWDKIIEGSPVNYAILSLHTANNYLFAGTNGHCVWRHLVSTLVGTENIKSEIPSEYRLYQNYPNPFNPITSIRFDVPERADVVLKVYDISGRETALLVNEMLQPGSYTVKFDASDFPSGVYFYRLMTDKFSVTKKMNLIK